MFANALNVYTNWDSDWEHIIFAENLTEKEAQHIEVLLIALFETNVYRYGPDAGYNCTDGGEGSSGYQMSEETKKKLSEAKKGKPLSPKALEKLKLRTKGEGNPMFGKHHTEETRKKLSAKLKGKPSWAKGITLSDEAKEKMSKARIGRFCGKDNPNYGNHKLAGANSPNYGTGDAVKQFDKDGCLIAEYVSASEVEKIYGFGQGNIRKCCKGIVAIAYGFQWRFSGECHDDKIEPYKNPKLKEVIKLDEYGNLVMVYAGAEDASKSLGIPKHLVSRICRNEIANNFDYQLMYKEDYEKLLKQND